MNKTLQTWLSNDLCTQRLSEQSIEYTKGKDLNQFYIPRWRHLWITATEGLDI